MRDVDVFWRRLDDAKFTPDLLSPDELDRAARFRLPQLRDRFIACRSFLREILAGCLNVAPAAIEFTYNAHGKPGVRGLHFNLSHSGSMAVYAVSRTREVGIDIERVDPKFEGNIPEHFFSRAEIAGLRSLPRDAQLEAFFRCWTRKEAYLKARGEGLAIGLWSFDVSLDEPAKFLGGVEGWSIEALECDDGYAGAVVAKD